MHDTLQRRKAGCGDFVRETIHCALVLYVADEDRLSSELRFEGLFARFGTHTVDHASPLLFQCPGDVPGNALPVGDTEDENGLTAELEKIRHHDSGFNLEGWNSGTEFRN